MQIGAKKKNRTIEWPILCHDNGLLAYDGTGNVTSQSIQTRGSDGSLSMASVVLVCSLLPFRSWVYISRSVLSSAALVKRLPADWFVKKNEGRQGRARYHTEDSLNLARIRNKDRWKPPFGDLFIYWLFLIEAVVLVSVSISLDRRVWLA